MMKIFRPFVLVLPFLLAFGSDVFSGSILSTSGIGLPLGFPDARSLGMGGVSIAQLDPLTLNRMNPASLNAVRNTRFSLQFLYESNAARDEAAEQTSRYFNFDGFSFFIPLHERIGIGMGLAPETRADYELEFSDALNSQDYEKIIRGKGGLNTWNFTLSARPLGYLRLGLTAAYFFGKTEETWRLDYDSADFASTQDVLSMHAHGMGAAAGAVFEPVEGVVRIGAIYRPVFRLKTQSDLVLRPGYSTSVSRSEEGDLDYPSLTGIGISGSPWKTVNLELDYIETGWNEFRVNGAFLEGTLKSRRYAFGAEFRADDNIYAPYWKRIAFRAGFSTAPVFVRDPSGNRMRETWISFGLGMPLMEDQAHMDAALQFGRRGSLERNGMEESLIRLHMTLTGGEKWFSRKY
ncbi:hypothetical protein JW906_00020 [bacterium]|nr:hypothetical protein [bacterium]